MHILYYRMWLDFCPLYCSMSFLQRKLKICDFIFFGIRIVAYINQFYYCDVSLKFVSMHQVYDNTFILNFIMRIYL